MRVRHARFAVLTLPLCILLGQLCLSGADEQQPVAVAEHVEAAPAPPAEQPPPPGAPEQQHQQDQAVPPESHAVDAGPALPVAIDAPPPPVDAPAPPSPVEVHQAPEAAPAPPAEVHVPPQDAPPAVEAPSHEAPPPPPVEPPHDPVPPPPVPIEQPSSAPAEVHPPAADAVQLHIEAPSPVPVAQPPPPAPEPAPVHVDAPAAPVDAPPVHADVPVAHDAAPPVSPSHEPQHEPEALDQPAQAIAEEAAPVTSGVQKRKSPRSAQRDASMGYAPAWEGHQQADGEHDEHGDPIMDSDGGQLPEHEDDKVAYPGFEEDYYGLNMNPADHVDPAAFQPSHIFEFYVEPGATDTFYEEVDPARVGRAVRGDWFVTAGDLWNAEVTIVGPDGATVYAEGPFTTSEEDGIESVEPTGEGSFRFVAASAGIYTVSFHNPSNDEPRGITFAWLFGRDDDDAIAGGLSGMGNATNMFPVALPPGLNASDSSVGFMLHMMARVSRLHKRIDELSSLQSYVDVAFRRHAGVAEATRTRVMRWTIIESIIVAAVAVLQVLIIRRFDVKPLSSFSGFPTTRVETYRSIV